MMLTQHSLAIHIAQFNFAPIMYTHHSWFPEQMTQVMALDPEQQCVAARKDLSAYLLKHYAIDQSFDFDFEWANKHIALLPPQQLQRFFMLLGLVLNTENIRRIVKGSERRAIKEFVDATDYDRALHNPLLVILKSSAFKVFRVPFPDDGDWQKWTQLISDMGLKLSAYIFRQQSDSFATRLCLKLPQNKSEAYNQACQETFQGKTSLADMVFSYCCKEFIGENFQAFTNGPH